MMKGFGKDKVEEDLNDFEDKRFVIASKVFLIIFCKGIGKRKRAKSSYLKSKKLYRKEER